VENGGGDEEGKPFEKMLQEVGDDSVCVVNMGQGLYLDAGGGGGDGGLGRGVSKFRFLKHSQVCNCVLILESSIDTIAKHRFPTVSWN
jgi:hypothetical protein